MKFLGFLFIVSMTAGILLGCSDQGDELACVEATVECLPLYEPNYKNVFERTLHPTCAAEGKCHNAEAVKGGLDFSDFDGAYDALVDNGKVIPGDPGCSEMVIRLVSSSRDVQMPPRSKLSVAERCAVTQWIANGAKKE